MPRAGKPKEEQTTQRSMKDDSYSKAKKKAEKKKPKAYAKATPKKKKKKYGTA